MTFIHPFDDPLVIAGQGTIGAEILRHSQDRLSAVFVPVGGGGLIAGIAGYIKALRPDVQRHRRRAVRGRRDVPIAGGRPTRAAGSRRHLRGRRGGARGRRAHVPHRAADGRRSGARHATTKSAPPSRTSSTTRARSWSRPARWPLAGLKSWVEREGATDQTLVAVLSGANMNFDRLRFVAERAELGEAREALLAVTIPERPGAFREFCAALGRRVVTEFNYRLSGRDAAHIFVGVATQSRQDGARARRTAARRRLRDRGPHRQRDGEAARPPHGGRPRAGRAPRAACAGSSSPSGPAR